MALSVVLIAGMLLAFVVGLSTQGGQIAFESNRDGAWNVYMIDVAAAKTVLLTRGDGDARWPAWSPDGQDLAFSTRVQGQTFGQIFVMDIAQRSRRQVTTSDGNHWHAAWSPDGRKIVFMFNSQLITVIDHDGRNEEWITPGFSPSWSPDGQSILYYDDPGRRFDTDIYTVTPDGRQQNNLTADLANDWSPTWSPDGRRIAFVSSREDGANADLYLLDAACTRAANVTQACGQAVTRLTYENGNVSGPAWSPDSRTLAYVVEQVGSASIYLIDADGHHRRPLTGGRGYDLYPAWRPLNAAD